MFLYVINKLFAILRVNNWKTLRIKNVKFPGYYFYMTTNILGDFHTCISVPLTRFSPLLIFLIVCLIFLVIFAKICHHNVIWRSEVVCHTEFWQWFLHTVLTMTMKLDSCSKINMHDWNFSAVDNFCFNIKKYMDQAYPMIQLLKAAHLQVFLLLSVFTVLEWLLWSCHTRESSLCL